LKISQLISAELIKIHKIHPSGHPLQKFLMTKRILMKHCDRLKQQWLLLLRTHTHTHSCGQEHFFLSFRTDLANNFHSQKTSHIKSPLNARLSMNKRHFFVPHFSIAKKAPRKKLLILRIWGKVKFLMSRNKFGLKIAIVHNSAAVA
jgi:tRNA nucleotidyltransferase/poly(A) polymerase